MIKSKVEIPWSIDDFLYDSSQLTSKVELARMRSSYLRRLQRIPTSELKEHGSAQGIYSINFQEYSYVGKTSVSFSDRWGRHFGDLQKGSHHCGFLQRLFNKHGFEEFYFCQEISFPRSFESGARFHIPHLNFLENSIWNLRNELGFAMVNGEPGLNDRVFHTEETKKKIGAKSAERGVRNRALLDQKLLNISDLIIDEYQNTLTPAAEIAKNYKIPYLEMMQYFKELGIVRLRPVGQMTIKHPGLTTERGRVLSAEKCIENIVAAGLSHGINISTSKLLEIIEKHPDSRFREKSKAELIALSEKKKAETKRKISLSLKNRKSKTTTKDNETTYE